MNGFRMEQPLFRIVLLIFRPYVTKWQCLLEVGKAYPPAPPNFLSFPNGDFPPLEASSHGERGQKLNANRLAGKIFSGIWCYLRKSSSGS